MKLYIGDYLGDTQHLSCLEHGAYILLIMAYWQNGGPLENDPKLLRRLTRTSPKEFQKCSENVLKMFKSVDGKLVHKRVDLEISKRAQVSTAARDSVSARWNGRNTDVLPTKNERNTTPIDHSPESKEEKNICISYSPDMPEVSPEETHAVVSVPEPEEEREPGSYPEAIYNAWTALGSHVYQPTSLWLFQSKYGQQVAPFVRGIHSSLVLAALANLKSIYDAPPGTYYWDMKIGVQAFFEKHLEKFLPANFDPGDFKKRLTFTEQQEAETRASYLQVFGHEMGEEA